MGDWSGEKSSEMGYETYYQSLGDNPSANTGGQTYTTHYDPANDIFGGLVICGVVGMFLRYFAYPKWVEPNMPSGKKCRQCWCLLPVFMCMVLVFGAGTFAFSYQEAHSVPLSAGVGLFVGGACWLNEAVKIFGKDDSKSDESKKRRLVSPSPIN